MFCLVDTTTYGYDHSAEQRFVVCVARQKGTRAHATRERPMDTEPDILEWGYSNDASSPKKSWFKNFILIGQTIWIQEETMYFSIAYTL